MIFTTIPGKLGEHYFYNYCDNPKAMIDYNPTVGGYGSAMKTEEEVKLHFFDKKSKKIDGFWRIPSNKEILKLENPF